MTDVSHLALAPAIEAFRQQFQQIATEGERLVAPLTDAQFTQTPAPGRWSVAQHIEHLNLTARVVLPMLDAGIADAIRRGIYGPGPYRYNWLGRLSAWAAEPPRRFQGPVPPALQPGPARPRQELMAAFRAYQVQHVDRLRQANGVDLARARVRSPAPPWLWIPLGSGFALAAAHQRQHLWEMRQVLAAASGRP